MNSRKFSLPLVFAASLVAGLASCGNNPGPSSSSSAPTSSSESSEEIAIVNAGVAMETGKKFEDYKGIEGGASGAISLVGESTAQKTKILGALEKYAVDNAVTGLPLFENGGYVMYNPRIVKGTNTYINGYGFGIMREGYLNADLKHGANPSYYHTYDSSDPATINYLDSDNSQVGDLYGYISTGFFGNKMNAAKTGYEWYGVLSNQDRPVLIDTATGEEAANQDGTGDTWRIYVRTGTEGGVTYRTSSTKYAAYDKKAVELEDYVNAFKILLCGKFGYYRGTELAGQTGYGAIKGAAAYNNASAGGFGTEKAEAAWANVGVKSGHDETKGDYVQFTLGAPTNTFYAMYSLASSLYQPINLDFFKEVTNNYAEPGNYGSYSKDKSTSPVDNILCLGPYYTETWEEGKSIVFKKNADWFESVADPNVYRIPGVHITVLEAIQTDTSAAIKEFLLGNIDAASIPTDYLDEFKTDPRTTTVPGDAVFKLNCNTCTQEQWDSLFGENGTVSQGGERECKPWMANSDFVQGLFFSIDRNTFATTRGSIPSINYFSSNYMSDPLNGVSYNTTPEHAAAQTDFWGTTIEDYGYSVTLAQACFDSAYAALAAEEKIPESKELSIDVWWMYPQHITNYGDPIAKYIEDAFNEAAGPKADGVTLKVNNQAVTTWSDVYYKHLMVGEFDLGFGSISGNSLDPLNFMEVLKSDNSSGFTLNWGPDTSKLDLEFEGKTWSFDTLWGAADHGIVTYKGRELPGAVLYTEQTAFPVYNETDDSITFGMKIEDVKGNMSGKPEDPDAQAIAGAEDLEVTLDDIYVYDGYSGSTFLGYMVEGETVGVLECAQITKGFDKEKDLTGFMAADGTVAITVSQDVLGTVYDMWAELGVPGMGLLAFGIDFTTEVAGVEFSSYAEIAFIVLAM